MNTRMNLLTRARSTLDDVSDASVGVVQATQWGTVALVATTAVSLLALLLAVIALSVRR